jgi:integrase
VRHWTEVAQHWKTARQAQIHNRTLIEHLGADTMLAELTFGQLASFVAGRRVELENASVNRETAHLRSIVNTCDAWGYKVAKIRWRSTRGPSLWLDEPENKQTLLPEAKEEAFLAAFREDFRPVVRFAVMSGQRRENVLGLCWDQIDWDRRVITFRSKSKKPGGKLHQLPLSEGLRALLAGERGRHPVFVFTYVCRHGNGTTHRRGERYPLALDGGNFRRAFIVARNAIGLPTLRFHDLRHTFGTRLAAVAPLGRVQQAMAHADIRTTLRYASTTIDDVALALETLETRQGRLRAVPLDTNWPQAIRREGK